MHFFSLAKFVIDGALTKIAILFEKESKGGPNSAISYI
jgi:hypothetical protein